MRRFCTIFCSHEYISGSSDMKKSRNQLASGLDASVRLSPGLTSAFTIYPDYGQVDADPDTIELRDTERFLRERRPFFREGSELFETPINIYYSRRFTDIEAGANVTGQGRRWALGLIDVEGEIMREDMPYNGNYHIGRLPYRDRKCASSVYEGRVSLQTGRSFGRDGPNNRRAREKPG